VTLQVAARFRRRNVITWLDPSLRTATFCADGKELIEGALRA